MESDLGITKALEFLHITLEVREIVPCRKYKCNQVNVEPRAESHVLVDVHHNEHPWKEDGTDGVSGEGRCVRGKIPRHPPEKEDEARNDETE